VRRFAPVAAAFAALPLLAFGPAERTAPTRWAVIVGIADYINYEDEPGGDLPGPENDARAMRDVLLMKYAFPEENILMLLSREATRANIEAALTDWLPRGLRPGDNVVVFYAGHGSQMWDESGDEDDGLDETLAPADVSPSSTELDISDDDFGAWLRALATNNVVAILDTCSSGTATREVTPYSRSRLLGRDVNTLEKPEGVERRDLPDEVDESGYDSEDMNVLELAAAQADQVAVDAYFPGDGEAEPFSGGAFSTFLVRELWRAPSKMTYEDIFARVTDALKRNRFEQDPHLSEDVASKSLELFFVEGGIAGTSEAFLPVVASFDGEVELGGGQTLGITTGSTFRTDSGARMVIEDVRQDRAIARVMEGSVTEGDRVALEGYRFVSAALRVSVAGIDGPTADAVANALEDIPGIEAVLTEEAFSHLLLRRRGNTIRLVALDGAIRHVFPAGPQAADDIVAALGREASAKRLGDMENLAQGFGLEVELAGGKSSFGIGENVQFLAKSERDGYLTLVDLGTDGTVTILFPNPYDRDNRVTGGEEITFPTASMASEIQALPPAGRGMVRAFLTSVPLDIAVGEDFTFGKGLLADQIAEAVKQAAGRVPGAPDAVKLDSWGSASIVYEIRR
jgi:caspase domain-containing protein/uncharacterized protein DUF4384